jgi:hypothetical protein
MSNIAHLRIYLDSTINTGKRQSSFPLSCGKVWGGDSMKQEELIVTDPFGSYTGLVKDPGEKPVQDADDL